MTTTQETLVEQIADIIADHVSAPPFMDVREVRDAHRETQLRAAHAILALTTPPIDDVTRSVPDGWKLVPVEPTEAMIGAGYDADVATTPGQETAEAVWSAMLSSCPEHKEGDHE